MHTLLLVALVYFLINLLCAVLLHLHGLRQAHPPLRFLEVLMHFVLFSVSAVPVLLVISVEAFFGEAKGAAFGPVAQPR